MKAINAKQFFTANVMFNLYVLSLGFEHIHWSLNSESIKRVEDCSKISWHILQDFTIISI